MYEKNLTTLDQMMIVKLFLEKHLIRFDVKVVSETALTIHSTILSITVEGCNKQLARS